MASYKRGIQLGCFSDNVLLTQTPRCELYGRGRPWMLLKVELHSMMSTRKTFAKWHAGNTVHMGKGSLVY